MELDIAAAMSGDAPNAWEPPVDLGPVPPELLERARLILDAQAEASALMGASNAETAKHLQAIDSIPEQQERPRLAFLDVTG
jgi:hypothetical protein